jgi:hypothetical protein
MSLFLSNAVIIGEATPPGNQTDIVPKSLLVPRVRIIDIEFIPLNDMYYEISWSVLNFENYSVPVRIIQTWILPNGSSNTLVEPYLFLPYGGLDVTHLCYYTTEQYGTYTFTLTLRDIHGNILDYDSISWNRIHPDYEFEIVYFD